MISNNMTVVNYFCYLFLWLFLGTIFSILGVFQGFLGFWVRLNFSRKR